MISMMMFFSWAALPRITLGIFVRKYAELGFYETLSLTANFYYHYHSLLGRLQGLYSPA